jgi:hypothetical protein
MTEIGDANKAEWWALWNEWSHNICFPGFRFVEDFPDSVKEQIQKYVDQFNFESKPIWNSLEEVSFVKAKLGRDDTYAPLHANRPRFRCLLRFLMEKCEELRQPVGAEFLVSMARAMTRREWGKVEFAGVEPESLLKVIKMVKKLP